MSSSVQTRPDGEVANKTILILVTMATRRFTFFYKLILLLWKNVKLKIRSPVSRDALFMCFNVCPTFCLVNSRRINMAVVSVHNITDIEKDIRAYSRARQ